MKTITIIFSLLLSFQVFSAETVMVNLDVGSKKIDLGLLSSQSDVDSSLNTNIQIKRDKNSAKKVNISYQIHRVVKKCVEFDVEVVEVPEFTEKVCRPIANGEFSCEDKLHSGLYSAKTVCVQKGLVQVVEKKSFKVSFKKAAALSNKTQEVFEINLKQKSYKSDDVMINARVIESPVRYNASQRLIGNTITFKVLH